MDGFDQDEARDEPATQRSDALWKAIGNICDLFDRQECWNYFKAVGYASD